MISSIVAAAPFFTDVSVKAAAVDVKAAKVDVEAAAWVVKAAAADVEAAALPTADGFMEEAAAAAERLKASL